MTSEGPPITGSTATGAAGDDGCKPGAGRGCREPGAGPGVTGPDGHGALRLLATVIAEVMNDPSIVTVHLRPQDDPVPHAVRKRMAPPVFGTPAPETPAAAAWQVDARPLDPRVFPDFMVSSGSSGAALDLLLERAAAVALVAGCMVRMPTTHDPDADRSARTGLLVGQWLGRSIAPLLDALAERSVADGLVMIDARRLRHALAPVWVLQRLAGQADLFRDEDARAEVLRVARETPAPDLAAIYQAVPREALDRGYRGLVQALEARDAALTASTRHPRFLDGWRDLA